MWRRIQHSDPILAPFPLSPFFDKSHFGISFTTRIYHDATTHVKFDPRAFIKLDSVTLFSPSNSIPIYFLPLIPKPNNFPQYLRAPVSPSKAFSLLNNHRPQNHKYTLTKEQYSTSKMAPNTYANVVSGRNPKPITIKSTTNPLSNTIPSSLATGWPKQPVFHTIHLAHHLRALIKDLDPVAINNKSRYISRSTSLEKSKAFYDALETSLCACVFGSNLIDSAGCGQYATAEICRQVWKGETVTTTINQNAFLYKEHILHLEATNRAPTKENTTIARKEVIQHAKALQYMIDHIVINGKALTEEVICTTHRILHDDTSPRSRKYRDHEVAVAYTKPGETKPKVARCIRESAVGNYMADMVFNLKQELLSTVKARSMDPYTLAARYAHQFVMIHPFSDGNGRMSRIILNTLLLKYAGHACVIGSSEEEKWTYLDLVGRAGKKFHAEDGEVVWGEQKSHEEFAGYVLERSREGLEGMDAWNKGKLGDGNIDVEGVLTLDEELFGLKI